MASVVFVSNVTFPFEYGGMRNPDALAPMKFIYTVSVLLVPTLFCGYRCSCVRSGAGVQRCRSVGMVERVFIDNIFYICAVRVNRSHFLYTETFQCAGKLGLLQHRTLTLPRANFSTRFWPSFLDVHRVPIITTATCLHNVYVWQKLEFRNTDAKHISSHLN